MPIPSRAGRPPSASRNAARRLPRPQRARPAARSLASPQASRGSRAARCSTATRVNARIPRGVGVDDSETEDQIPNRRGHRFLVLMLPCLLRAWLRQSVLVGLGFFHPPITRFSCGSLPSLPDRERPAPRRRALPGSVRCFVSPKRIMGAHHPFWGEIPHSSVSRGSRRRRHPLVPPLPARRRYSTVKSVSCSRPPWVRAHSDRPQGVVTGGATCSPPAFTSRSAASSPSRAAYTPQRRLFSVGTRRGVLLLRPGRQPRMWSRTTTESAGRSAGAVVAWSPASCSFAQCPHHRRSSRQPLLRRLRSRGGLAARTQ